MIIISHDNFNLYLFIIFIPRIFSISNLTKEIQVPEQYHSHVHF